MMSHIQHSVYHALFVFSIFNVACIMSQRNGAKIIRRRWFPESDDLPDSGFSMRVPLKEPSKFIEITDRRGEAA